MRDWEEPNGVQTAAVSQLAVGLSQLDAEVVVLRLAEIESMALRPNARWPRWMPLLCEGIACLFSLPNTWAMKMIGIVEQYDLILPFLEQAAARQEPGWVETVRTCLDRPELQAAAIIAGPQSPRLPRHYRIEPSSASRGTADSFIYCVFETKWQKPHCTNCQP